MEVIAVVAMAALAWLVWQLIKAKKYNRFKLRIEQELKPQVIAHIIEELEKSKSELTPNTAIHQQATIYYWCQYKSRILQAALIRKIIDKQWLINTGNLRNCQHLFHIEQRLMNARPFSDEKNEGGN